MTTVFAGTSYYLALLAQGDVSHEAAVAQSRVPRRRFVTTDYVLTELGAALSHTSERGEFLALWDGLVGDPNCEIVPAGRELLLRAKALYAARPDKHWSLTDCTSFVVMTDAGLTDALTGDRHFLQASFRALLLA